MNVIDNDDDRPVAGNRDDELQEGPACLHAGLGFRGFHRAGQPMHDEGGIPSREASSSTDRLPASSRTISRSGQCVMPSP
jgi:hypothetical protein